MSWQRGARFAVAVVGLACAATLYWKMRDRPAPPVPGTAPAVDPKATVQGGPGKWIHTVNGKSVGDLSWETSATYEDGHSRFTHATITSIENGGFAVSADVIEGKGRAVETTNPPIVQLTDHVHVVAHDGLEIFTDSATYDQTTGLVEVPGAMRFTRGRLSGDGQGAKYDRDRDVLSILDRAHVAAAPDAAGTGALDATATRLTLARTEKNLVLDEHARILRDGDTLAGDTATLVFTDDEKQLKLIALRQHASVMPGSAAGSRPPEMHGDTIDLVFQPDGLTLRTATLIGTVTTPALAMLLDDAGGRRSITGSRVDFDLAADGRTLTRLVAQKPVEVRLPPAEDGRPARTIQATALTGQGTEKAGLTLAQFDGDVVFIEQGKNNTAAGGKRVTSQKLLLKLKGQIDAIDTAEFRQDVKFVDLETQSHAEADLAEYQASSQQLHLMTGTTGAKRPPHADNGRIDVTARTIDLALAADANKVDAVGDVHSISKAATATATATTGKSSAFFDDDRPIHGWGGEMHYVDGKAEFRGVGANRARVEQDASSVTGDLVTLFTDSNNLSARQSVVARFELAAKPGGRGAGPGRSDVAAAKADTYVVHADALDYDDARRLAVFTGKTATMEHADGKTTALRFEVKLAPVERSLESFVATGTVRSALIGRRDAEGDRLDYDAKTDVYTLSGSPSARVRAPEQDAPTCGISMGSTLIFGRLDGSMKTSPDTVYAGKKSCEGPIK